MNDIKNLLCRLFTFTFLSYGLMAPHLAKARFLVGPSKAGKEVSNLKKELLQAESIYVAFFGPEYTDSKLQEALKNRANKKIRAKKGPFSWVVGSFHPVKIVETLKGAESDKSFSCPSAREYLYNKDFSKGFYILVTKDKGQSLEEAVCKGRLFSYADQLAIKKALDEGLKLKRKITDKDFEKWETDLKNLPDYQSN